MEDYDDLLKDAMEACDGWYRIARHLINCLNPECQVRRRAGLGIAVSDLTYEESGVDVYEGCLWPDEDRDPFDFMESEEPF